MKRKLSLIWLVPIFCCSHDLEVNLEPAPYEDSFIDGPAITRSEMILIAHEFTRVHWTMKKINQTGNSCNGNFRSEYPVGPRIGMGYMWGGWDDVSTFLEKIAEGHGTGTGGNVSYQEFSKECVTGTSCTGLVSRAWHLNKKYTLNYPQYPEIKEQFHRITTNISGVEFSANKTRNLKKGDAFINQGHIILFVYETRDKTAMIIDSRSSGVGFREMSWQELSRYGYKAIRYNNIKEIDYPVGTIKNPIVIRSDDFPVMLSGNTRDVVSMEFDHYPIDPSFNEQGPEVIYKLELESIGDIDISINEINNEGINNNIYLLNSLMKRKKYMASECIARGDSRIVQMLNPGTYYIVIDSGHDKPGEFELTVDYYK